MKKFIFALTWAFILPLLFSCSSLDSNEEDNTTTCINPGLEDNDSIDTLASGVTVLKKGNLYYYEGDIVLTESQLYNLALYGDIPQFRNPTNSLR